MSLKIIIVFFVLGIALIFLGLIFSIIILNSNYYKSFKIQKNKFFEEKRALEMQFLKAQIYTLEQERERIAVSFHDDINPLLAALKIQLHDVFMQKHAVITRNDKQKLINDIIDKIIENQHAAIRNLAPKIENITQLSCSINEYLNCITRFKIEYEKQITYVPSLDSEIVKNMYSIFLELMHNLIKHDNPNLVKVYLKSDYSKIELILSHDGLGLTKKQYQESLKSNKGRGFKSIDSRLNYIGAKMDLLSVLDGAIIHITLSLKNVKGN